MTDSAPKIRLFIDAALRSGAEIALDRGQSNYLVNAMRLEAGALVAVFNGREGEWRCVLSAAHRKAAVLTVEAQMRVQEALPDIELLFAPIKKARTDFIVEKACETGCRRVRPVITRYTNSERMNIERLHAHMIEAAEQCGGLSVPELDAPKPLADMLAGWDDRLLIFCDEARTALPLVDALADVARGTPASVLIGPEGGFAPEEAAKLHAMPAARAVSLGPRILRADTAAVAALGLVQAVLGDWGA